MKFWKVTGYDDLGDDVDGYFTSAAEEEIPSQLSAIKNEILYYEVEDIEEVKEIVSDYLMYTCEEIVLFPNINYN
jgi:hypothetical protein